MGGNLTMKNGKVDKYLFGGGYAQASVASSTTDNFAFYFYNQDHLESWGRFSRSFSRSNLIIRTDLVIPQRDARKVIISSESSKRIFIFILRTYLLPYRFLAPIACESVFVNGNGCAVLYQ